MEGPKIRILVDVPAVSGRPQGRLVIPIASTHTVGQLAEEIVRRRGLGREIASQISLALPDGSQLFPEDQVGDVIHAEEVIRAYIGSEPPVLVSPPPASAVVDGNVARTNSNNIGRKKNGNRNKRKSKALQQVHAQPTSSATVDNPPPSRKRVKIAVVTPELARNDRNDGNEEVGKLMAFQGSSVSVDLPMGEVRREIARTLGWLENYPIAADYHENQSAEEEKIRGSCACTVANQIYLEGRFEQLHCSREINGQRCFFQCRYSHAALGDGILRNSLSDLASMECPICMELFGFPCEKCIIKAGEDKSAASGAENIRHCPLVQNAGCKHIFHAHCYFARTSSTQGCPAGCPRSSFSAEAVPFDMRKPHLVVVYSGSVIDTVPLPERYTNATDEMINLDESELLAILTNKYAHFGHGLSVRMFGRANTGVVSFRHSTIVSICCASRHDEPDGIRRFELNGPYRPVTRSQASLYLHTASSPIFNQSSAVSIEDLGLDSEIPNGGQLTLYVTRGTKNEEPDGKRVGKAAVYTYREEWQPSVGQSDRGMATFLSSLLVFANYLSTADQNTEQQNMKHRMLHHLLALTCFPPAVRSLYILIQNETVQPEEMRALSDTMYHLALDVAHPQITKGDTSRVFEGARIMFGVLIERTKRIFTLPQHDQEISTIPVFQDVTLACELSGEPLRDPVAFGGRIVERNAANVRQQGGALYNPSEPIPVIEPALPSLRPLILQIARRSLKLPVLNKAIPRVTVLSRRLNSLHLAAAIDMANVELQIHAPLSLHPPVTTPSLTLDQAGYNAVYVSRGGPCSPPGEDVFLLRPCHGGEVGVDVNTLAVGLQPIIEARKRAGEWDIDAFGSARMDRVDTRDIEEAIVVALDISRSMEENFNPDDDFEEQNDPDEAALKYVREQIAARQGRGEIQAALTRAKEHLINLDCMPSIVRHVYHGQVATQRSWWGNDNNISRRERVEAVIDELKVLYIRQHWQMSQSGNNCATSMLHILEDFIAATEYPAMKDQLVEHLMKQAATAREVSSVRTARNIPMNLIDPLSGEIFRDPVQASDGLVYERSSIEAWLKAHNTSPMDPTVELNRGYDLMPMRSIQRSALDFRNGRPRAFLQPQKPLLVKIRHYSQEYLYIAHPRPKSLLSILLDEWSFWDRKPSSTRMWHGLKDYGDGSMRGSALMPQTLTSSLSSETEQIAGKLPADSLTLDRRAWHHIASGSERLRADSRSLSRLDIVKQAFEAFVDKSEAFNYPVAIGIVTFGKEVREVQPITLLKEEFRNTLQNVKADGDTPLFDSLHVAHTMLERFKAEHPSAASRIICLTDGVDVNSKIKSHVVTAQLQRSNVIVDSIAMQTGGLRNILHPISVVTGGYSFKVDTLENALNIVALETVLWSKDRVPRPPKPVVSQPWQLMKYNDTWTYPVDVVTAETCPQRKPHARLHEPLRAAQKAAARSIPPSTDRQRRLMQEIRNIVNSPHPAIDIYAGDDLAFWKVVIEAPHGSPYDGGTFLAYVDFGESYPQVAPEIRFITPILHPNINRHGKVCHAALDRGWLVDMTMSVILQILYGLLLTPDTDNPLDLHATMEYNDDTGQHALKVHEMVRKHASKTRRDWRNELGGGN
ncbi:uncharacterized protein LAESUDRAFT_814008 [Laetiporus sulphureus 93-53]|uniref:E2 ubiquitin-conjugating enzyme n=1 Tax=Laetiporus sulphureus 93-53 TaxID=1314785 RepID=A0A165DDN7_9APHY|nr:uncharacterized protein LAESUDRAFT_814008 [Laetiporus sulphureus 93-53]KZT04649.1 hypothetical protein LAESUDRAFT_814008 [Laetiporus sulphureus 93-53]